jgi:hypothetical protein
VGFLWVVCWRKRARGGGGVSGGDKLPLLLLLSQSVCCALDGGVEEHCGVCILWVAELLQLVLELLEVGMLLLGVLRFLQKGEYLCVLGPRDCVE